MKYTARKLARLLEYGTDEELFNFIKEKSPNYEKIQNGSIIKDINKVKTLELYQKRIGFSHIGARIVIWLMTTCNFRKGKFLIENGLNVTGKSSAMAVLNCVSDFSLFKYLIENVGIPLNKKQALESHKNVRILKYVWESMDESEKEEFNIENTLESMNKIKFLESINKLNKLKLPTIKHVTDEKICNYLFDNYYSNGRFFGFFLKEKTFFARKLTKHMIEKLAEEDFEKTKLFINEKLNLKHINDDILNFMYKKGLLDLFLEKDKSLFNILYFYRTSKGIRDLLMLLNEEDRRKLLNEKNDRGQSVLFSEYFLENMDEKDIDFLIANGLDFSFTDDEGDTFLSKSGASMKVKQYFLDKGVKVNDIAQLCNYMKKGKNCFKDYIEFAENNKIQLPDNLIDFFFRYEFISFEDFQRFLEIDKNRALKIIREDDGVIIQDHFKNKKSLNFMFENLLTGNRKQKERDAGFIIIHYPPRYLNHFMKKGFDINVIDYNSPEWQKGYLSEDSLLKEEFICELKKIKIKKERDSIAEKICILNTESEQKRKRM